MVLIPLLRPMIFQIFIYFYFYFYFYCYYLYIFYSGQKKLKFFTDDPPLDAKAREYEDCLCNYGMTMASYGTLYYYNN